MQYTIQVSALLSSLLIASCSGHGFTTQSRIGLATKMDISAGGITETEAGSFGSKIAIRPNSTDHCDSYCNCNDPDLDTVKKEADAKALIRPSFNNTLGGYLPKNYYYVCAPTTDNICGQHYGPEMNKTKSWYNAEKLTKVLMNDQSYFLNNTNQYGFGAGAHLDEHRRFDVTLKLMVPHGGIHSFSLCKNGASAQQCLLNPKNRLKIHSVDKSQNVFQISKKSDRFLINPSGTYGKSGKPFAPYNVSLELTKEQFEECKQGGCVSIWHWLNPHAAGEYSWFQCIDLASS